MATAETWEKRVAAWRASGLSAAEYCAGRDFKAGTLYWWSSRVGQRPVAAPAIPLLRVVREPEPPVPPRSEATGRGAQVIIEVEDARVLVPAGADVSTVAVALEALAGRAQEARR